MRTWKIVMKHVPTFDLFHPHTYTHTHPTYKQAAHPNKTKPERTQNINQPFFLPYNLQLVNSLDTALDNLKMMEWTKK
jgi:hypothetical protein